MGKLRELHHRLAEGVNQGFHALEERVKNTPGISRLDVIVEGLRDAILGGSEKSVSQSPYLRDSIGMQRYMIMPILVCVPLALFSIWLYGWRALAVIVVTYLFGALAELAFVVVRRHEITEGLLVTGILFALSLPPTVPLWMVAVGIVFGIVIGKEIFGGTGHNIFNVAITGRAFLLISFPVEMTTRWWEPLRFGTDSWLGGFLHYQPAADALTTATPLQAMKFDGQATPLLDLFLGVRAGSMGESSILLLALGAGLLIFSRVVDWRLTAVMMATIGLTGQLMHMMFGQIGEYTVGNGLFMMLAGSALFAATLNVTDPVTSPMTTRGKIWLGIIVGVLTVLIRTLTGYNEGITFAILLGNMFVPLLDRFTLPKSFAGEAKAT